MRQPARARLDPPTMDYGLAELGRRDPVLDQILAEHGAPPFWQRRPGWQSLALIILEQQVSLQSARAAWRRLRVSVQPFSARALVRLRDRELRALGITRQKSRYLLDLAEAVVTRRFDAARLARLPDHEVRDELCELNGVGRWTADCYLLFALRRADVWPPGDIALRQAIAERYGIPRSGDRTVLTDGWRPWRSVAARLLWHDYLSKRA